MNNEQKEIIDNLMVLGFTEYEAKVYLSLITKHPASAYSISQASGVPHARVYDITRRLIDKGAAILAEKEPNRFSPLAPIELIAKLKKEHSMLINTLKEKLEKVSFSSDFDPVWNFTRPEEAISMARDIILKANEKIYIGIWDKELQELLPAFIKANKKGVEINFLIYGKAEVNFGTVYHHSTEKIKDLEELGRNIDCVVDSNYCITGSLGQRGNCRVVWTQNKGLIKSIEEYIVHDFYLAEVQKYFGPELFKKFGKNLSVIRKKFHR